MIGDWEYEEASDLLAGTDSTPIRQRLEALRTKDCGMIFLRRGEIEKVELSWNRAVAVVGHRVSEDAEIHCAVTDQSITDSEAIDDEDVLGWTCGCCGVSLGDFAADNHISKDLGFEIFANFLSTGERPVTSTQGALLWSPIDVP